MSKSRTSDLGKLLGVIKKKCLSAMVLVILKRSKNKVDKKEMSTNYFESILI